MSAAEEALGKYPKLFHTHHEAGLRAKLGLITEEAVDSELTKGLLDWMQGAGADFTSTFAAMTKSLETGRFDGAFSQRGEALHAWHDRWMARLMRQQLSKTEVVDIMRRANPVIIPRNHRVEEALAAAQSGDLTPLHRLCEVLAKPFEETAANQPYREAPSPGGEPYRTFCGT